MIGRASQGNPWIFKEIEYFLKYGKTIEKQNVKNVKETVLSHLDQLYSFYGNKSGVKIARKHIGWYFDYIGPLPSHVRKKINLAEQPLEQLTQVSSAFTHFN